MQGNPRCLKVPQMADTQDVFNQSPPFVDVDLYATDLPLREAVAANGGTAPPAVLSAFARHWGSAAMFEQARLAIEALRGPQSDVDAMVAEFRARRDLVVDGLNEIPGFRCIRPQGAFYVMADIARSGLSGREFALQLVTEHSVAVAPGDTFGPAGRDLIRISLASDLASLAEGARRIIDLVNAVGRSDRTASV